MNEKKREAVNLATRRDKDSTPGKRSKDRSRLLAAQAANGGAALPTSFTTDAIDWFEMHELRIEDQDKTWRVLYRIDNEAIVILEVFEKKTQKTPREVIEN